MASTCCLDEPCGRSSCTYSHALAPCDVWGNRNVGTVQNVLQGHATAEPVTERPSEQPTGDPLLTQVRRAIAEGLPTGKVCAPEVARVLCMSESTLRRRLARLGASYQAQLDDVRRQLAMQRLPERHTQVAEVAFSLGFSNQGSFTRAFRRWTGESPSQYRRAVRSGLGSAGGLPASRFHGVEEPATQRLSGCGRVHERTMENRDAK